MTDNERRRLMEMCLELAKVGITDMRNFTFRDYALDHGLFDGAGTADTIAREYMKFQFISGLDAWADGIETGGEERIGEKTITEALVVLKQVRGLDGDLVFPGQRRGRPLSDMPAMNSLASAVSASAFVKPYLFVNHFWS